MSSNRLLLKFALRYPVLIILTIILGFSGAIFNGVSTALIIPIFLALIGQEDPLLKDGPQIVQKFMSLFEDFTGDGRIFAMFAMVLLAIMLKNGTGIANTLVSGHLARSLTNTMRLEGLKLLLDLDLDFYCKNQIGDIVNRLNQEVNRTVGAIKVAISMVSQIITILIFTFVLLSLSWQLTILASFLLSLAAYSNQYFVNRSKQYGEILSEKSRQYTNKLLEILTGMRLIKTVNNEKEEYLSIEQFIKARQRADFNCQVNYAFVNPVNEVSGILAILAMVLMGRYMFAEQLESFSAILLIYLVFLFRLLPVVGQLNNSRSGFANVSYSAQIIMEFLRRDNKPIMTNGNIPYTQLQEGIRFEHLSFAYPGKEDLVLKEIDLWIPKGQTVALVGASGAGKSTIADLLPRFYDPIAGKILVDGKDLKAYDLATFRSAMGIVSQDTFLFNNTLNYNIAYGKKNVSQEEIIEAAKKANAYEFITQLPQGFETEIGDRGVLLSGGQKQRIAIARALLRNPDILILDEATSALDTVSEKLVQSAIDELCRDRTTLVIAHRLSTVQKAHQIIVLDQGEVVEIGSHQELLSNQNSYYYRLYHSQFETEVNKPQGLVLPGKEVSVEKALKSSEELRSRIFHEIRTSINSTLGSLQLVNDGLIDNLEEQNQVIRESYNSAMELLEKMESLKTILPENEVMLQAALKSSQELRTGIFYQVRANLNSMLGSLRLIEDGLMDNQEEKYQLIEDSCKSAILLLGTMESFEEKARQL